jgi:hypothetical protein
VSWPVRSRCRCLPSCRTNRGWCGEWIGRQRLPAERRLDRLAGFLHHDSAQSGSTQHNTTQHQPTKDQPTKPDTTKEK